MTLIRSALATGVLLSLSITATAQELPRTPDGKPDLQGVWSNQTLTPLTRNREFGETLVLSMEQVQRLEDGHQQFLEAEFADSDPNREPGAGAQSGDDGDTEDGYNEFWKEVGTQIQRINGEYRASIIVDPPNGQIPYIGDARSRFRRDPNGPAPLDGPEGRPLAERCLLSFGNHSGPPMLPVMYNNNYQIVQTDEYVMILAEMVHDARIIRLHADSLTGLQKWMGDSVGRWEGDTLIVETQNFHPQQRIFGAGENLKVTERFTRVSPAEIIYAFTVEDPSTFSQPWSGELVFNAKPQDEKIYEYACHEGNYALPGILAGARTAERDQ
jgi:hypothetical protein